MTKVVFSSYPIDIDKYHHLQEVCPLNTFRTVDPNQVPLSLPSDLCSKSFKAVVVGSGDTANAVYMVNLLRVDKSAIDQQPLIIAYHSGDDGVSLTAGFIHHGSWDGRTVYPEKGFFHAIEGSGITGYYPYVGVPKKEFGSIDELQPESHKQAFWNGVKFIKKI